jgi:uncharacterized membrane protein YfcA
MKKQATYRISVLLLCGLLVGLQAGRHLVRYTIEKAGEKLFCILLAALDNLK